MGILDTIRTAAGPVVEATSSVQQQVDDTSAAVDRQFDDTPGGGFADPSPYEPTPEQNTDVFGRQFGDGSNRWVAGTIETLRGEGKNDVAGVFDALALNFDEGVGGLVSLLDSEPGNTAGPGDMDVTEQEATTPIGKVMKFLVENPLLVVGAVLALYLTPLLTTSLGVVQNVTE